MQMLVPGLTVLINRHSTLFQQTPAHGEAGLFPLFTVSAMPLNLQHLLSPQLHSGPNGDLFLNPTG